MPDRGLRALAVCFAALFAATMWPIHPLFSRARPFVLGLPVSLLYVMGIAVLSFVLLLAYELRTSGRDES